MESRIDQLFIGRTRTMLPEGGETGIYKSAVSHAVELSARGLSGDEQGDLRNHGGVEKALHQYPAEHYRVLAGHWPERAALLQAGVLGENISSHGMLEDDVCIGDVFRIGAATVQVSQPRAPCWKIDRRIQVDGASRFVEQAGITGWYYRVLEPGPIAAGDSIRLLERPNPQWSLACYWEVVIAHRPNPVALREIAALTGLAPDKAARWLERALWLETNALAGKSG